MEQIEIIQQKLLLKKHDDESIYIGVASQKTDREWVNWVRLEGGDLTRLSEFLNRFLEEKK